MGTILPVYTNTTCNWWGQNAEIHCIMAGVSRTSFVWHWNLQTEDNICTTLFCALRRISFHIHPSSHSVGKASLFTKLIWFCRGFCAKAWLPHACHALNGWSCDYCFKHFSGWYIQYIKFTYQWSSIAPVICCVEIPVSLVFIISLILLAVDWVVFKTTYEESMPKPNSIIPDQYIFFISPRSSLYEARCFQVSSHCIR